MKYLNLAERYYKFQTYVDISWGELSWFSDSLVELMAILYILEKIGIVVVGGVIIYALMGAYIFFFFFGLILKRTGIYDKSQFVDAEIDPVSKENLEASRKINESLSKILEAAEIIIKKDKL